MGFPYIVGVHVIHASANMYLAVIPFTLCCLLCAGSHVNAKAGPKAHPLYIRDPVKDKNLAASWRIAGMTDAKLAKLLVSDMDNYQRTSTVLSLSLVSSKA